MARVGSAPNGGGETEMNQMLHSEIDHAILSVARGLTDADAAGLGARVQERLRRRRRAWWMPFTWAAVAAAALLFVASTSTPEIDLPMLPANLQANATAPESATVMSTAAIVAVVRTRGGTRRLRSAGGHSEISDAEREWRQRAVPELVPAAPIELDPFGPLPIDVPALRVDTTPPPGGGR